MDRDNKVVIDINDPSLFEPAEDEESPEETDVPEVSPEEQAERFLEAARREADKIILDAQAAGIAEQAALRNAAKSEVAAAKEQAKEEGYNEGLNIATREGDAIRAQARQVLAEAEAERAAMQKKLEPEIVDLLIRIMGKLTDNAVSLHPEIILTLVKMGMHSATITGDVTVYVSPGDFETVTADKDKITALTDGSVKLDIVKDLSLNPMDCVIETPFGNIDSSLGQQLEALRQNITYLLNG
jgi:flagellar assembly protein FliH